MTVPAQFAGDGKQRRTQQLCITTQRVQLSYDVVQDPRVSEYCSSSTLLRWIAMTEDYLCDDAEEIMMFGMIFFRTNSCCWTRTGLNDTIVLK